MVDTETKTAKKNWETITGFETAKRSRVVFFVANLALAIPFVIRHYSLWGLGSAFAILLVSFCLLFMKGKNAVPAVRDIPLQLFLILCLCLAVAYQSSSVSIHVDNLEFLGQMEMESHLFLLAGLAVGFFLPKKRNLLWLRLLGKTSVGIALVMTFWTGSTAKAFVVFYLTFALLWIVFCVISCYLDSSTYTRNSLLTDFLLLILFLFAPAGDGLQLLYYLTSTYTAALAWWSVIPSVIVLACGVAVTYDYQKDTLGVDALVLTFAADALVILNVLMKNYTSYQWIVFVLFLISCIGCFRNELQGKKTLHLSAGKYTIVQLIVSIISIWLIAAGLWINILVAAAYTVVFYTTAKEVVNKKHRLRHWLTVLSAPAVWAAAYIWQMQSSPDTILLVALAYAVFAMVMIILHWPHPSKLTVPRKYKIAVCGMLTLLGLIAMLAQK